MNSFGRIFRITSFGESHGIAIGGVVDGIPSNVVLDIDLIQQELDRRKPGQNNITTRRNEDDKVIFLSGLKDNKTLGSPIAFIIYNKDHKSVDYKELENIYRPSHADYTYQVKYGIRDVNGGGRTSARETAIRVVAGAIAKQILSNLNVKISAFTKSIGNISIKKDIVSIDHLDTDNIVRCPEEDTATLMIKEIEKVKKESDSIAGIIRCIISNPPIGIGEPIYDKLSARLAYAIMSINAVRGFSFSDGFDIATKRASQVNDTMKVDENKKIIFNSNNSAGIQGGISNGENIYFDVAFKPTATISQYQDTITTELNNTRVKVNGRHDPCVVPRAVPIVEAMAAIVILDMVLLKESNNIRQSI